MQESFPERLTGRARAHLESALVGSLLRSRRMRAWLAASRLGPRGGRVVDLHAAALLAMDDLERRVSRLPELPLTVGEARRSIARKIRSVDAPAPPGVVTVDDRVEIEGRTIPVRIYTPAGLRSPSPALVYYHGGGWVTGSVETHDPLCRKLALGASCRVVSVDYRLAPEHRHPAGLEDAVAAYQWTVDQAPRLGIDPARVGVGGDSAGANFATLVAHRLKGARHPPLMQLLLYPVVDATGSFPSRRELAEGFFLTANLVRWFFAHYLESGDPKHPHVSPLFLEDVRGLAPMSIYTAGFDPLRDEGLAYAERLREAGVTVRHHEFPSLVHGFAVMTRAVPAARIALEQIITETAAQLSGR